MSRTRVLWVGGLIDELFVFLGTIMGGWVVGWVDVPGGEDEDPVAFGEEAGEEGAEALALLGWVGGWVGMKIYLPTYLVGRGGWVGGEDVPCRSQRGRLGGERGG